MDSVTEKKGPIVIGGVGGSGTRVVAEILSKFGFYIGNDLNSASDNLLYTLIFKRPKWFYKNYKKREEIVRGINLFHKLMLGGDSITKSEYSFLLNATGSMALSGHNATGDGRGIWPVIRLLHLLFAKRYVSSEYIGWGWKEPNSHLLIENLADYFDDFRYIHTIRHGLDMAFSKNQQQLYNWGPMYGVQKPSSRFEEPSASFKYWIKANDKVLDLGEQIGDDRFLLFNFDQLCQSPELEIQRLITFLDIEVDNRLYEEALSLPETPGSIGRYKLQDISQFDEEDISLLSKFGFSVE